ncbi:hypothetical protein M2138_000223 [Dysgonomonadaceae bacterium PH5-43]|nr:hypothetical protein [Dysgonomonadaceae bacterium PH5-43]
MKHIALACLIIIGAAITTQAQTNNSQLEREMTLEREYNPNVRDANKINHVPQIKEPEAPKTKVEYSNFLLDYNIPPYLSTLKAKPYLFDYTSNKRGYLNVGVSTAVNFDGDFGYQILNTSNDFLSLHFSHRSTNSKVDYLQADYDTKMKINDNVLGVDYSHYFNSFKLFADMQYTYSSFNYYGYRYPLYKLLPSPTESFNSPAIDSTKNQVNNMFRANVGVASLDNGSNFNYTANLAYTYFKQKYGESDLYNGNGKTENGLFAYLDANAKLGAISRLGASIDVKHYSYKTPVLLGVRYPYEKDYTTITANPYLSFLGDDLNIKIGLNVGFQVGDFGKAVVSPNVTADYNVNENVLLYVKALGGFVDNSNYNIYYENRYLNPTCRIADSRVPLDAALGAKFRLMPNFGVNVFAGYKIVKDEHFYGSTFDAPFFYNDLGCVFFTRYSNSIPAVRDANVFKLGAELNYAHQDLLKLGAKATYYNWDVDRPQSGGAGEAYNKPIFEADVNVGTKIQSAPLYIDLNYHLEAGRKTSAYSIIKNMKNINDLSLKVNYLFNDSFTVFAQANNLLFQEYDIWYGYPAQKFNVMAGINIKF